jgi:type I restriction enzyme S subunit
MRELVLEWAATGKLCHNPSAVWRDGVLGDVIELISGQHLLANEHNDQGLGIPYLTGPSDFGDLHPIPTRWTEQPKVTAIPGDILITVKGSGVGKTNVLARQPTAISRQLMAIRVTDADPEFVHVVVKRAAEHFQNAKTGIAIPGIGRRDVLNLNVVLPPLAEQKRIVAKVDELMALCDRWEAQQQERDTRHAALARASLARFAEAPIPANLDFLFHPSYPIDPADLRKAILSLAVQGKLVPQDPCDEPAEVCLGRLGLKSTLVTLDGVDDSEDLLPPSWIRVRFEDVALVAGGVTLGRKLGTRKAVSLPYLRVANVKRGEIDLGVIKKISLPEDELERYALRENDLLMTEGGDWDKVGRAAIWRAPIPICLHQNHVFRARMRSAEIAPEWFERYFNSPAGRGYFESAAKQTTNLASINMRQVRGCPVPIPPLTEQRRIVDKVDQLMALVDRLEAQLTASSTQAEKLMEAVVGELTTRQ